MIAHVAAVCDLGFVERIHRSDQHLCLFLIVHAVFRQRQHKVDIGERRDLDRERTSRRSLDCEHLVQIMRADALDPDLEFPRAALCRKLREPPRIGAADDFRIAKRQRILADLDLRRSRFGARVTMSAVAESTAIDIPNVLISESATSMLPVLVIE